MSKGKPWKDAAKQLHALLRAHKFGQARRILVNRKTGKIRYPFSEIPNHSWYVLGDIAYRQNNTLEAKKCFKRALVYESTDVTAMMALGNCYSDLGQPRYARAILEKALAVSPHSAHVKYNLANALFDLGIFEDAIPLYRRASASRNREVSELARKNLKLTKLRVKQLSLQKGASKL
jgi:tetratricopeptide (TPR) repeat protein